MTKLEILNKNIAKKAQSKLGITYNQKIKNVALESMQEYADQQLILSGVGNCPDLTNVWNEAVINQEKGKHNLFVTNECWGALRLLEKNGLCKISSHLVE